MNMGKIQKHHITSNPIMGMVSPNNPPGSDQLVNPVAEQGWLQGGLLWAICTGQPLAHPAREMARIPHPSQSDYTQTH